MTPPPIEQPSSTLPNTALRLLEYVNQRVKVPYDHFKHLQNGIRIELGDPGWSWPAPTNTSAWESALIAAMKHAEAKVAAVPPETVNLSDEMERAMDAPGEG